MDRSIDHTDLVMINPMQSYVSDHYSDGDELHGVSICSEDSSVGVLYRSGELPELDEDLTSISNICVQEGPPLEQREDILKTKRIPEQLKESLNFNDEGRLKEAEEQMKSRENIDRNMENNIEKIKSVEAIEELVDVQLLEAALVAREKTSEVRQVAKEGKTTLKRAMEVMEVALPPFLLACGKSYEKNDLTEEVDVESQLYEQCLMEKKRAAFDFELGQQKGNEAREHLNRCIDLAKSDETRIAEKRRVEKEAGREESFMEAKKLMDDIIQSEVDDVHTCLESCRSDLATIDEIEREQSTRFDVATEGHKKHVKTMDMKLSVNKQQQDDLRKQLLKLEEQEKKLKERRQFELQVQERARELNEAMSKQVRQLHTSISNIEKCANTSLKVMQLMKEGGGKLLTTAIKAEDQYLNHLTDLDIEAKTKWRNAVATSAVDCRICIDNATTNTEEYKETYKGLKEDLNKAVQRQQRLHAEKLKKEMKEYKSEMKEEEKKKVAAEEELAALMALVVDCDEKLRELGRSVNSVDELYEWRKQEISASSSVDHPSIEFTESEDEEDTDDENDE